jgi:hypothetical protein
MLASLVTKEVDEMRLLGVLLVALVVSAGAVASATAAQNVLKVKPGTVNFGAKPFLSETVKSTAITNTGYEPILLTLGLVRSWDDFAGGRVESTCSLSLSEPTLLAPGESCTLVEAFIPHEDFAGIKQDQIWLATATNPESGTVLETSEIVFFGRGR